MDKITISKMKKDVKLSDVYKIYNYIIDGFISEVMERKQKIELAMGNTAKLKITYLLSNQTIDFDYDWDANDMDENFYIKLENNFSWNDPMDKKSYVKLIAGLSEKLKSKKKNEQQGDIDNKGVKESFEELRNFCIDFFKELIPVDYYIYDRNSDRRDSKKHHLSKKNHPIYFVKDGCVIESSQFYKQYYQHKSAEEFYERIIAPSGKTKYNKLPPIILKFIEENKKNGIFSYIIDLKNPPKKEVQKQTPPVEKVVLIQEEDKTRQEEYKVEILIRLKDLDMRDDKYNEEQLIPPIPIPDYVFYSSITDEKKEVDPFFRANPGALKYCNLSKIDFDKADIRELDLSENKEADIDLNAIYKKDITGTNLKNNMSLKEQSLEGVNANRANLMGTFVVVPLDTVFGTHDTIFDTTCRFMVGIENVSHEKLRKAGYIINPKEIVTTNLERDASILFDTKDRDSLQVEVETTKTL